MQTDKIQNTHQTQSELRETMQRAEKKIADICDHFERLTGHTVRGLHSLRWDSGGYSAQLLLGPRVAPPAASAPSAPLPCERG